MKSLYYYNALSAEHLSSPGAVVNNASPRREGPANEVDGVPLHCVTHEAGWLAGRPAAARGGSARAGPSPSAGGSYRSDIQIDSRIRGDYGVFKPARPLLTFTLSLSLHMAEMDLNAVIRNPPTEAGCR